MPSPPLSIVQSLSPRIAVLTSDDVVESCEANGCRGLEELLRPWEGGTERVSILSSTLTPTIHPTFPLRFVSYASVFPNPEVSTLHADVIVDSISSAISSRKPDDEQHYPLTRSLILSSRPTSCHETFNHPVGVVIAISTSTIDPMGTLQRLYARTTGPMSQAVPWMDGVNVMRFFVVIHDDSRRGTDMAIANELLAAVKKAYGPHSTLLVINSQVDKRAPPPSPDVSLHPSIPLPRPLTPEVASPSALSQIYASALSSAALSPNISPESPRPSGDQEGDSLAGRPARKKLYGSKLSAEDTQRLAALVRELSVQSLIPWMEGRIREWNEVWHSNRRGITGRLFGAGRKLFSSRPSSPAPNAAQAGYNATKGYYPTTAVEALTRRLADFAFMLRDYKFASTVYDSLRRDFAQDRAWRYAAAATEMYGLSLLLSHNYFLPSTHPAQPNNPFTTLQHTDISSWLEQAVLAYQGRVPASQIQLDALRITILYYEAWKTIGEWRGVGAALVKAAGDVDEVPNAVIIEESATADIRGGKSDKGKRRRAFHLILAARRYETTGLKKYSRRCLERASKIYRSAPWNAAQDSIEYSLGRQAYTLGESDIAVEHFLTLLRRDDTAVPGSQGGVLEDLALAYEQLAAHPDLLKASASRLHLPEPIFDVKATRIAVPSAGPSGSGSQDQWTQLEQSALGMWDRKGKKPLSLLPDTNRVRATVGETWEVELVAMNPLNAPLVIANLRLQASPSASVDITPIEEITLEPYESKVIAVPVTVSSPSSITFDSVSYMFHRFFPYTQPLEKRGKRLHATKEQRITPTYAKDTSLTVEVGESRPKVVTEWEGVPEETYEGEEVEVVLKVTNTGKTAVKEVQIVSTEDGVLRLKEAGDSTPFSGAITPSSALSLPIDTLEPSSTISISIILTTQVAGQLNLLSLIVYSSAEDADVTSCSQAAMSIMVQPLASCSTTVHRSKRGAGEYLISLDVNNGSSSAISLDAIEPVSLYWELTGMELEPTLIHPNQSYRAVLQVSGKETSEASSSLLRQEQLVEKLTQLIQGQTDFTGPSPPPSSTSAISIAPSYLTSRRRWRLENLRSQFPTLAEPTLRGVFPLLDPLDVDLRVSWSLASDPSRRGTTMVHGVRISPEASLVEKARADVEEAIRRGDKSTRTMYEETGRLKRLLLDSILEGGLSREDDPIDVDIKVGDTVKGRVGVDLSQGPSSIPLRIEIRNRSPILPARWILYLPRPDANDEDASTSSLNIMGPLAHRGTLQPLSIHAIVSSLWITQPGMLDVSGWTVEVETGDETDGQWTARKSWKRHGQSGLVQVVQAP